MKLKTRFERKANEIDVQPFRIIAVAELDKVKWDYFSSHLLENNQLISQFSEDMYVDGNGIANALLVLKKDGNEGILINSEGSSYARYPFDINNDGICKLWKLHGRREIDKMPSICLAMCQIRSRNVGEEYEVSDYVSYMKSQYKPHRDTESSEALYDSIKDKIALIESDLKRKDALTASQIQKQNCDILSLALDCIRFCGATEREELSQMKQPLSQNM